MVRAVSREVSSDGIFMVKDVAGQWGTGNLTHRYNVAKSSLSY